MRMIEQPTIERPGLACVRRFEKRRRLDATVKRVRLVRMALRDLPDLFQRSLAAFGKFDVVSFRVAPGFSKVIRLTKKRSKMRTVHRRPQTLAAFAPIVSQRIDRAAGKVRPGDVPVFARAVGTKQKRALHRADQHEIVACVDIDLICGWHDGLSLVSDLSDYVS